MLKYFRAALVWMMVLAIPTQGFAAATMLYCGPGHQSMLTGPVAAMPAGYTDTAAVQHATPAAHSEHGMHDHAASGMAHEASPAAATDQASATESPEQSPNAKCSVCAFGCNAAAIISAGLVIPAPGVSYALVVTVLESPVSFFTDGPKRPPRTFLA